VADRRGNYYSNHFVPDYTRTRSREHSSLKVQKVERVACEEHHVYIWFLPVYHLLSHFSVFGEEADPLSWEGAVGRRAED